MDSDQQQIGLFSSETSGPGPLASRLRPEKLEEFIGFERLLRIHPYLNPTTPLRSLVLWGAPGSGKTTLAQLLARASGLPFRPFNAVLSGVPELKKILNEARKEGLQQIVLFIDEIHRFNKAQQDALLPSVEEGSVIMIGATTENPRSALNKALLSRVQLVELAAHEETDLQKILALAATKLEISLEPFWIELLCAHSMGDARRVLAGLELILSLPSDQRDYQQVKTLLLKNDRAYDKNQDRHYDVISAFIKSLRGSDPDAALLWLAVMLDGGEDPVFIARRLVILASEDIGNADPQALTLAVSTMQAVSAIGMPEARINLAQAVCYLAATPKSNACYLAINEALSYVQESTTMRVPDHLRNFPPKGSKPYLYPHDHPEHLVKQNYTIEKTPQLYRPTKQGIEARLKERLEKIRGS
jgi:putative ATPase